MHPFDNIIKTGILPSLFVAIFCCACNSSDKPGPNNAQKDTQNKQAKDNTNFSDDIESVETIRAEYEKALRAIKTGAVDSTFFEYDCHGEKTGTVTYYRSNGKVRMVENRYNELSHRDAVERYFVSNSKPYFIFHRTSDWAFDTDAEDTQATKEHITEKRYYVLHDTLAQCLNKDYRLRSASGKNPDPEQIANVAAQCPPVNNLMDQYKVLISHKNETSKIKCL